LGVQQIRKNREPLVESRLRPVEVRLRRAFSGFRHFQVFTGQQSAQIRLNDVENHFLASPLAHLSGALGVEPRVYARVVEGEIALAEDRAADAVARFAEAQAMADTWLGRFGLGRAYLAAGAFTEADSELDRCLARRGEATAVFLDDIPTWRLFADVHYYKGRALEGLGSAGAADAYKTFLAIKAHGDEQGLVADARRRLESR